MKLGRLPLLLLPILVAPLCAAEPGEIQLALEVHGPARPGFVPEAAPLRFALTENGTVFVGGTSVVLAAQLEKSEQAELEKRAGAVRKLGPPLELRLGPGEARYRLRLGKGHEIVVLGEPSAAPPEWQAVAKLVSQLAGFNHPGLRPWAPAAYLVRAVEQSLPGGCRRWTIGASLAELSSSARPLPATQVAGWPTGANAASVCADGRRYAVTFRPLLPGEFH